ncbi:MAG: DUF1800 domain-containing protein [Nocardioidaceae bacterium]
MPTLAVSAMDAVADAASRAAVPTAHPADRHLLSRFSYGVTPAMVTDMRATGGSMPWLNRQLTTSRRDGFADSLLDWFPNMAYSPQVLWQRHQSGTYLGWMVMADLARWTLLRRIYSNNQVHEVMTDFWSNLLHVSAPADKPWPWRIRYDAMIRRHALGRFDDLLAAAITHPAMGCYLDNAESTKTQPNENLGRELLELHTVGVDAGYTEDEVKQSALLLTGYRVDIRRTWNAWYSNTDHYTGRLSVMGFTDANSYPDGRVTTRRYLNYLAHHPLTARRIARRLCVHFVSDDPSAALVTAVADAYSASGTDIASTLRALVQHPEFAASVGAKVRTPSEDAVATYRALGVQASRPTSDYSFANAILYQTQAMGQRPFDWPRPDGFPDVAECWTGVSRVLNSFQTHFLQGGSHYPDQQVVFRTPASWLPKLPASFGDVVDHVSRQLLARPANNTLTAAVSTRLGIAANTRIGSAADLPDWRMARILSSLLDTPAHMTR